ncbi:hypothetical protein F4780DRAFT_784910 [Xylariomycetidae sp. FL0641]|nr:hypothetical protein F4780DRAFT_784910 [Xylariomycetidae sp. FL0641]
MGSGGIAPPHAPEWLVPPSTVLLAFGVFFWDITYILITMVYGFYAAEMAFERLGFALWLLLDLGLAYTTVRFAPEE